MYLYKISMMMISFTSKTVFHFCPLLNELYIQINTYLSLSVKKQTWMDVFYLNYLFTLILRRNKRVLYNFNIKNKQKIERQGFYVYSF